MNRVAFKILLHDRAKYLALVLGIAFATLLISQQSAIFHSVIESTTLDIKNASEADIWVMKPSVETIDSVDPIPEITVNRVRSAAGVKWAVPYYQSTSTLRTTSGISKGVQVVGIDESSLIGGPKTMLIGSLEDLSRPDGVIIDVAGFAKVFGDLPPQTGIVVEIGQMRAEIVGICHVGSSWSGLPRVYARRAHAVRMARETMHPVSFVLARAEDGKDPKEVAAAIQQGTGLMALSRDQFMQKTQDWIMKYSGVAENFGITILMGIVIGVAIVGQTFYMFSAENLRQFAALKAIGVRNSRILGIILLQASFVAVMGYCLGIGVASLFFMYFSPQISGGLRGMFMHPVIFVGTGIFVFIMTLFSSLISVRKVLFVDPAMVFR